MFKASNKSTIWYNVADFEEAGVEPPETWDELNEAASTLKAAGITPYSVGRRRRLADHGPLREHLHPHGGRGDVRPAREPRDPVDRPVGEGRADLHGRTSSATRTNMAGGTDGALQTEMPGSVAKVFSDDPEAAMVIIGDFAPGVVRDHARAGDGLQRVHVPVHRRLRPRRSSAAATCASTSRTSEAATAFLEYLTTPEAAEIWAARGGFSSPNKNVDDGVYPDEITRATATALAEAETFRFDMSDLQPSAFGGTPGAGSVQGVHRLRPEPGRHRRDHAADGDRRRRRRTAARRSSRR